MIVKKNNADHDDSNMERHHGYDDRFAGSVIVMMVTIMIMENMFLKKVNTYFIF